MREPGDRGAPCGMRCARPGSPAGRGRSIDRGRYRGYLEAHIEQGADLEDHHLRLGIVTAIVGSWRFKIEFKGQQNHAGTTRMAVRKDAGRRAGEAGWRRSRRGSPASPGRGRCGPRATSRSTPAPPNIVPGGAEMIFQFRDTDPDDPRRAGGDAERADRRGRAGPCAVTVTYRSAPTPAADGRRVPGWRWRPPPQRHAPGLHQAMPSGAGHDAQIISQILPSAMLFVPSIGGISHHYTENTARRGHRAGLPGVRRCGGGDPGEGVRQGEAPPLDPAKGRGPFDPIHLRRWDRRGRRGRSNHRVAPFCSTALVEGSQGPPALGMPGRSPGLASELRHRDSAPDFPQGLGHGIDVQNRGGDHLRHLRY